MNTIPKTLEENNRQIREKLEERPHLDAGLESALGQAIADESQQAAQHPAVVAQVTEAEQEKAANVEGWKLAVMHAVPMIEAFIPEFKDRISREQWEQFGIALGEACDHYGLGVGEAFSHPLVKLAIAAFPIGFAGWQIKQARIAQAIEQSKAKQVQTNAPRQEPEQKPMQTGSVAPGVTVKHMTAEVPAP